MTNIPRRYFKNSFLHTALESASLVILDMNGLIVDDEELQLKSVNTALEPLSVRISEQYWIQSCVGKRADEYFRVIMTKHRIRSPYSIDVLVEKKNAVYRRLITSCVQTVVRPGITDFIEYVSYHPRLKLALATSALPVEAETILGVKGLGLLNRFAFTATGRDVQKSKPNPEIYEYLTRKSGVPATSCLVFEDSKTGVTAVSNAGMKCIVVPNRFTEGQDFSAALCIIDNMTRNAVFL